MQDETASAVPETTPKVESQSSNLLDIAKERAMRRARRQKVRLLQQRTRPAPDSFEDDDDEENLGRRTRAPLQTTDAVSAILNLPELPKAAKTRPWGAISFFFAAIVPTIVAALYYAFIASPQYVVESQFAVRGAMQNSLSALGLASLAAAAPQSGDSYVVTDYIHSAQILTDIKEQSGLDIREIYAHPSIDFLYRKDANEPLDTFRDYWRSMVNVSYNSTTGNVTLRVFAFSPEDAKVITDAVLTVSEHLVNSLSERSRQQLIGVASEEVAKAEERLRNVRSQMADLRRTEQAVDPTAVATMESSIIAGLEQQLAALKTRYKALIDTISPDAPSAKVIERQIAALEAQLSEQRNRMSGDPGAADPSAKTSRSGDKASRTLPELITRFAELGVDEEFAVKAYTTSLAALEAAIQEARKQDLYFGVYVAPRAPEIALYPLSVLNTLIVLLATACLWLIGYFAVRSIKDHAI